MADIIRGSSDIPLSKLGRQQAADLGQRLKGQVDNIYSSNLGRTKDTAAAILATNPHAKVHAITAALQPWRLGGDEGKPTADILPSMQDRISNNPDAPSTPGGGEKSTMPGESFNEYKSRLLGAMRHIISNAEPGKTTVVSTHYRPIRTVESWLKTGTPDDSIDTHEMLQKGDSKPGDLFYLHPDKGTLEKVLNAAKPGVYMARHGATEWNEENEPTSTGAAS